MSGRSAKRRPAERESGERRAPVPGQDILPLHRAPLPEAHLRKALQEAAETLQQVRGER